MLGNGNRVVIELAEALASRVPLDEPHFLFAADGASAVEQALKIAYQYWVNTGERGRDQFLSLGNAYHGDTMGSLSVGDGGFGTGVFDPMRFPVLRAPGYDDIGGLDIAAQLVRAHAERLVAVVIEPLVQGANGMFVQDPAAFAPLAAACDETGVLLICDEVATGFGRTGTLFASEQCSLRPDLLCIGKGITGGYLPMAATVANRRVYEAFLGEDLGPRTFSHGHSYGGNALAAAVALRHLELIDEWGVLANVCARGEQLGALLDERLGTSAAVREIRRRAPPAAGMRWGRRVSAGCVARGVLIRPLGDVVVVMPPLTITSDEVQRIVEVLTESIAEVTAVPE
jgi:adenosylmethionine-8-amino-7-oxononanoate aminotransferase